MSIVTGGLGGGAVTTWGYGGSGAAYVPPPPPIGLVPSIEDALLVVPAVAEETDPDQDLGAALVIEPGLASAQALAEATIDALELEPTQDGEAGPAPDAEGVELEPAVAAEHEAQGGPAGAHIVPEAQTSGDSEPEPVESMHITPDVEEDGD